MSVLFSFQLGEFKLLFLDNIQGHKSHINSLPRKSPKKDRVELKMLKL